MANEKKLYKGNVVYSVKGIANISGVKESGSPVYIRESGLGGEGSRLSIQKTYTAFLMKAKHTFLTKFSSVL